MNSLLIAIIAGLGSMIGWGTADFFAKKTIDIIGDVKTLFWAQLVGVVPLTAIFLVNPQVPQLGPHGSLFLILLGVASALSYLPFYNGLGKGEVSLLSPVFASYSVVLVILAALFLHESMSPLRIAAIAVVFCGILLINTDPAGLRNHFKRSATPVKGLPEVLSAMLAYSFWLFFLDKFLQGKDWVFPLLAIRILAVVTLLGYAWLKNIDLGVADKRLWKFLACIGLFDVAAFAFVSYGFSNTNYTSVIAVLSATFSIPTIILAAVFLKEKIKPFQAVAIALILAGVAIIALR